MTDVEAKLDKSLSNVQDLINLGILDKLYAMQQQVIARIDERLTAIEQKLHHFRAERAQVHEHLLLRDKPGSLNEDPASVISALQDEPASVKPKLSTVIDTGAITAEVSP